VGVGCEEYKTVYPGEWAVFEGDLANLGNVEDTIDVGLSVHQGGWQAQYCIGPQCFSPGIVTAVTLPAGGHQPISVKLKPPEDAPAGQTKSALLWGRSQSDPDATGSAQVTAEVILP
jgi:uncharacterized membrane protein